jgi:hypothetical protein
VTTLTAPRSRSHACLQSGFALWSTNQHCTEAQPPHQNDTPSFTTLSPVTTPTVIIINNNTIRHEQGPTLNSGLCCTSSALMRSSQKFSIDPLLKPATCVPTRAQDRSLYCSTASNSNRIVWTVTMTATIVTYQTHQPTCFLSSRTVAFEAMAAVPTRFPLRPFTSHIATSLIIVLFA